MSDWLYILLFIAAWLILQRVILPKLGVPTERSPIPRPAAGETPNQAPTRMTRRRRHRRKNHAAWSDQVNSDQ